MNVNVQKGTEEFGQEHIGNYIYYMSVIIIIDIPFAINVKQSIVVYHSNNSRYCDRMASANFQSIIIY